MCGGGGRLKLPGREYCFIPDRKGKHFRAEEFARGHMTSERQSHDFYSEVSLTLPPAAAHAAQCISEPFTSQRQSVIV